jgi:hypothetical protein
MNGIDRDNDCENFFNFALKSASHRIIVVNEKDSVELNKESKFRICCFLYMAERGARIFWRKISRKWNVDLFINVRTAG